MKIEVNSKFAYFLGIICGDGYVSNEGVVEVKAQSFRFLQDTYITVVEDLFQITPKIIPESNNANAYRAYFYSIKITKMLNKIGIKSPKTFTIRMPKCIRNSTIKNRINFVCGMFDTDGNICTKINKSIINYPTIKLESRSKKLIDDITSVLIEVGLRAKKRFYNKRNKLMFVIRLYGFKQLEEYRDKIKFLHPEKLNKGEKILDEGIKRIKWAGRSVELIKH